MDTRLGLGQTYPESRGDEVGVQRQRYNDEFKRETVRYIQSRAKSITDIAEELNIPAGTLHKWVAKYRSFENEPLTSRDDLMAAKRRIEDLEEENAILKKALHFFSKDRD